MITGRPVDYVRQLLGDTPTTSAQILVALHLCGAIGLPQLGDGVCVGSMYIATVPSLNIKGSLHNVLVDVRDSYLTVYDPNVDREGKEAYTDAERMAWCELIEERSVEHFLTDARLRER